MPKEFGPAWQCNVLGGLASVSAFRPSGDGTYFLHCTECGVRLLHKEIAMLNFDDIMSVCRHFENPPTPHFFPAR